jgi:serine O-acetyltransferase
MFTFIRSLLPRRKGDYTPAEGSFHQTFGLFEQDALRWLGSGKSAPASELTFSRLIVLLYRNPGLRATAWFRLGWWCQYKGIRILPSTIQHLIYRRYGMDIVISASIGGGLYIAHTVGMVIAPRRIGKNCSLIASTTIGMRNEWSFPEIGDNVFIGAGARVLGGIILGDNAVVGANAVVINDVPSGATVVGIPAKTIKISAPKYL